MIIIYFASNKSLILNLYGNDDSNILATTDYPYPFISAIEKENIFGVQFHPEKSQKAGEIIINNFLNL